MPLFLLPILSFLRKYWLPLSIVFALLAGGTYLYLKGGKNTALKLERKAWEDMVERTERGRKVIERGRKFKDELDESRRIDPVNDERSSCLLSSRHPREECKEHL